MSKSMQDVNATLAEIITRPRVTDLFSYKNRATKRLLRQVFALADALAESESISNDAITAEVWFACVAPVHTGYWEWSSAREKQKKVVLAEFQHHVMNIIVKEIVTPSAKFQEADERTQDLLPGHKDWHERLKQRCDEYGGSILACINDAMNKKVQPYPAQLGAILSRRLFGADKESSGPEAHVREMTGRIAPMLLRSFEEAAKV